MELVTPNVGTIFWMVIVFGLVMIILKKFAWKPILNALNEREESISNAITAAKETREEVERLKIENERAIEQTKSEKDKILKEAITLQQNIVAEAKEDALAEAEKSIEKARKQILLEQKKAMDDLKIEMTEISFVIAEKIIRKELSDDKKHREMVSSIIDDIKLN